MAALTWNSIGERFFNSGVDRGVLFVEGLSGVAWSGLTEVTKNTTGTAPRPYYMDGIKYLNYPTPGELEGSISAFYSPPQFDHCDGSPSDGLPVKVGQQSRRTFSLAYRTLIGNDVEGARRGYKIHLIYDALAEPSDQTSSSLTNDPEAAPLSWTFSTQARPTFERLPTSHLEVTTLTSTPEQIAALEATLYGTPTTNPRMPSPNEVLGMMGENAKLTVVLHGDGTFTVIGEEGFIHRINSEVYQLASSQISVPSNGHYTITY